MVDRTLTPGTKPLVSSNENAQAELEAAAGVWLCERLILLEARLGTILNIAEGELTAKAQQGIAKLARDALFRVPPPPAPETCEQPPMPFKDWAADIRTMSMQQTIHAYKDKIRKLEYQLACRPSEKAAPDETPEQRTVPCPTCGSPLKCHPLPPAGDSQRGSLKALEQQPLTTVCQWEPIEEGSRCFNTCKPGEEFNLDDGCDPYPFCHWCGRPIELITPSEAQRG